MSPDVRRPAVAGQFYPANPTILRKTIEECFLHEIGPRKLPPAEGSKIIGLLCPHAGYMYSGPVAAHSYLALSAIASCDVIIIIGPNHYGIGSGVAVPAAKVWQMPLGEVPIAKDAAEDLVETSGIIDIDDLSHIQEHSIEVQIPFLQFIFSKPFKILPVSMLLQDKRTAIEVGEAVAEIAMKWKSFIIASSDLTHYEPHEIASKKDRELVKAIENLDVDAHYETLRKLNLTACGYGPIAAVMTVSKILGAKNSKLLQYATSGDTGGSRDAVVGYAAMSFS
ncbi:MAG: MEMO1 family protein [Thaumarchaeota archaeon]|nr:MEMO1 family protein [Nitrososphaerota archaeon]